MTWLEEASALRRVRTSVILSPEDYGGDHEKMIDALDLAIRVADYMAEVQAIKQREEKNENAHHV